MGRQPEKRKKSILGIIPARMGSSRFPGKPLADISGKAMIYHVYYRSKMSKTLDDIYIATPDKEIEDYCIAHEMNVVMTRDSHQRASDRAAEALLKIERKFKNKYDIVVMIQGDEPLVYPAMISTAIRPLIRNEEIVVSNLMSPIKTVQEFEDPNEIKVVTDKNNFALYFSRKPIPSGISNKTQTQTMKQVCIIPFQRNFLLKFNRLKQTPLEIAESIDMLRCLEHGYRVKLVPCDFNTCAVDTKEDLVKVRKIMQKDKLHDSY